MARFCSTQGAKGSTVRNRLLLSLIRSVIGKPGQNLILVMIKAANLKVVHLAYGPLYWSSLRHCSQPWRGPACSLRPSHKRQWNSQLIDDGALASLEPTFEGDGRHKNAKEGFSFTAHLSVTHGLVHVSLICRKHRFERTTITISTVNVFKNRHC